MCLSFYSPVFSQPLTILFSLPACLFLFLFAAALSSVSLVFPFSRLPLLTSDEFIASPGDSPPTHSSLRLNSEVLEPTCYNSICSDLSKGVCTPSLHHYEDWDGDVAAEQTGSDPDRNHPNAPQHGEESIKPDQGNGVEG